MEFHYRYRKKRTWSSRRTKAGAFKTVNEYVLLISKEQQGLIEYHVTSLL